MYQQQITRQNPACFLFLLDQSGSMIEPFGGSPQRKCDQLALAINRLLQNLAIQATRQDGIRDYMQVGVLGYRTDPSSNPIIESCLKGPLAGQQLVPISEIAQNPLRVEDREQRFPDETGEEQTMTVKVPIWVEPKAEGGTPMCTTLHQAYQLLDAWASQHPDSFPPILINLTDGENTEEGADPLAYAEPIKEITTNDGNVLVFNCHLSASSADPILFPSHDDGLPDALARSLFHMSSAIPESLVKVAQGSGFNVQAGAKGMVFNADIVEMLKFLEFGTKVGGALR